MGPSEEAPVLAKVKTKPERADDGVEPVTPSGRGFLHDNLYTVIVCVLEFKEKAELQALRNILGDTLAKHPRFHSRLDYRGSWIFKKLVWIPDTDFDIANHVVEGNLQPEDEQEPAKAVERYMARTIGLPHFEYSRPLWEAHLIHIPRKDSQSALIFRLHHALGDGTALMSLLLACTRQVENPELLPTIPGKGLDSQSIKGQGKGGPSTFRVLLNTMADMANFMAVVLAVRDSPTPIKAGPKDKPYPCSIAVSQNIALDDITSIRKAQAATVNDVLLAALTLGLEKYLSKKEYPLKKLRVTAVVFMNLREARGLHELAAMMKGGAAAKKAPWGNRLGVFLLPLPLAKSGRDSSTDARAHVLGTLERVRTMCDGKKTSLEAHLSYLNGKLLIATAGPWGAALALRRMMAQTTMAVSNMLGPLEEVSLGGNPITSITPTVPPPAHALCCHFQSYNGQVKMVVYAASKTTPDPDSFCSCFIDSFEELKAAAIGSQVPAMSG